MIDLLKGLNKGQKEAVEHVEGPSIVLAGAGSGKTRVLVHKVLNLIQNHNVDPHAIVMITFTNKAANEMKERIKTYLGSTKLQMGYVGTFHSFCCYLMRRDGHHLGIDRTFNIYDTEDQQQVIKGILKKINTKYTPSYFLNRISGAKNMLVSPEKYLDVFSFYGAAQTAEVYHQYQKELKNNMALDFDDLLMRTVELFSKHKSVLEKYQEKFKYLLVDEFQDTNYAQYLLTKQLAAKYHNVTAVGDFSQSIYSWRGADIRNLEKFSSDFPETKVIYLEQNYRSSQNILDYAYEIISQNQTHPVLKLFTSNEGGEEITYYQADNEEEESVYVCKMIQEMKDSETPYSEFAVLYRTNAQSRVVEEAFLHYGIPYTLIGGTRFYERKEIKDILSYLRLLINPVDTIATERIKKLGKGRWDKFRNFYQQTASRVENIQTAELLEQLFVETGYLELYDPDNPEEYARLENIRELKSVALNFPNVVEFLEQVALVESEYFEGEKKGDKGEGVRLMTLHQAKGLEFNYVFIVGLEEGILPHSRSIDDIYQLEEERRLFYVGITRARKKLYLTHARRRFIFGRRNEAMKSRFITKEDEFDRGRDDYRDDIDW